MNMLRVCWAALVLTFACASQAEKTAIARLHCWSLEIPPQIGTWYLYLSTAEFSLNG